MVLNKRQHPSPPTKDLLTLIELILMINESIFNKTHYLQTQGTAMETNIAPSYANIFMGHLEEQLLSSLKYKPWMNISMIYSLSGHQVKKTYNTLQKISTNSILPSK